MPVLLVGLLEVVEVEQHQAEVLAGARAALDLAPQAILQRGVVEAAGEPVGVGREREARRGAGVAARDGGELAEGLQQREVLARDEPRAAVAEAQRAA